MSVNNNESKIFPNRIWEVIILLVLSLIPVGVIMSILIEKSYGQRFIEVAIVFVMAVFVVGVSFLINRIRGEHQSGWSVKDFSFFGHALFLNVIFTALLAFPLFGVIGNSDKGGSNDFLSILAICLIGPVSEELMFRGVFLRGLLSQYKPWTAIWTTSLIFSIMHWQPLQIFFAFPLSVLYCYIYYKTRNLLYTIILHVISNSISTLLAIVLDNSIFAQHVFMSICLSVAGLILTAYFSHKLYFKFSRR